MPAIETSVWLALKARVASLVLSPAVPVVWPKGNAPASGKYLEAALMPNRVQRPFIGSQSTQVRPGILQLMLVSPITPNEVSEVDLQLAAKVAEHFPTDLRMTYQGVTARVTRAPDVAMAYRDQDKWRTPISVFFEVLH